MGLALVKSVSVLMACYQGAAYLPEQLASLAAQDDPCFRVLMQDDGSADDTLSLLQAQAQADRRFSLAAEGGGRFGAIGNFLSLLRQDTADYTALCDQDDRWEPQRLSRCREALAAAEARYGEATPLMVHSDCRLTDEAGAVLHESFFRHQGWDPAATTLPRLLVQNNVTGCTLMMNAALRRLVCQYGNPDSMVMHDWFIALTAAAFGRIVFLDEPLVRYRQHGHNVQGASQAGLTRRGLRALSAWKKGKARIAMTYRHARAFLQAFDGGAALPDSARDTLERYLATETMPKPRRVWAVMRGGYTMQSPITRLGQAFFG